MQLLSLCAFGLCGLLAFAFGLRYLSTREFMPYQAAVLGKPWTALELHLQAVILGMLKVAGAGLLAFGCTISWLLLPLQRGMPGPRGLRSRSHLSWPRRSCTSCSGCAASRPEPGRPSCPRWQ